MQDFFAQAEAWARTQGIAPPYMWMAFGAFLVIALRMLVRRRDGEAVDLTPQSTHTAPAAPVRHIFPSDAAHAVPGLDLAPDVLADITTHLRAGDKIRAIKVLREATGLGLAEAKSCVEAIERKA